MAAGGGSAYVHGRSWEWMEMPPLTLRRWIWTPAPFTTRRSPRPVRKTRPTSEAMPPLRLLATTAGPAADGMVSRMGPFTEASVMGLARLTLWKLATTPPLTVERSAWPRRDRERTP